MKRTLFVTGIGTEIGKTYCSAMLTKALQADYWKPIQAGDLHDLESEKVKLWSETTGAIHASKYLLNTPASPHHAADLDQLEMHLEDFECPETSNHLIIEGAGGLLVPINQEDTILDLIQHLDIPVVVVIRHYLGSINHSLMTLDILSNRGIKVDVLIFNGPASPHSEAVIEAVLKPTTTILRLPDINWKEGNKVDEIALDWANKLNTKG